MLIQLISDGENISVVEFCARTGGGVKFLMIKKNSGFDVVKAVVDLTLGLKPHVGEIKRPKELTVNEFVYCSPGELAKLEGFDTLVNDGIAAECSVFKPEGTKFEDICGSGDRLAYFSIVAETEQELKAKHTAANQRIKAIDTNGNDIIRHDLIAKY